MEAKGRQSGKLPLSGLAPGHYALEARLGDKTQSQRLDIMESLAEPDGFYVTTLGSGGDCATDLPEGQERAVRAAAASGLNLIRGASDFWRYDLAKWGARHHRAWGDQIDQGLFRPA